MEEWFYVVLTGAQFLFKNPFENAGRLKQGSPLSSLSVPSLVLMDRYWVSFLFWRPRLLSPLVAKPLIPLVSSTSLTSP